MYYNTKDMLPQVTHGPADMLSVGALAALTILFYYATLIPACTVLANHHTSWNRIGRQSRDIKQLNSDDKSATLAKHTDSPLSKTTVHAAFPGHSPSLSRACSSPEAQVSTAIQVRQTAWPFLFTASWLNISVMLLLLNAQHE